VKDAWELHWERHQKTPDANSRKLYPEFASLMIGSGSIPSESSGLEDRLPADKSLPMIRW
jgi:hypothetical protein